MKRLVLGAVAAVFLAASVPAAQTPSAQTRAYKAPRTPDGQPDLQGFWTNSTYTPLERPDGVTKALYTPEEAEAAIKLAIQRESAQTEPGTTADVHYDFSQFGLDRSQSLFVAQSAHVAHRRSAEWQDSAADGRGQASNGAAR